MEKMSKILLVGVLFVYGCNAGLDVVFEKSPDVIEETLTRSMKARCSVNQTTIGSDIKHVSSIVILRNGAHLATVSQYDSAKALDDLDNLNVTGAILGSSGELGYIELLWSYPSSSQEGEYMCEINALDALGHGISFSKSLEVSISAPTTKDLIRHVHDIELQNIVFKNNISDLTNSLNTCQNSIKNLPASNPIAFSAGIDHDVTVPVGKTVVYNRVFVNEGNGYDPKTGKFVCKKQGLYRFDINLKVINNLPALITLRHNNENVIHAHTDGSQGYDTSGNNVLLKLSVGDVVEVYAYRTSALHGLSTVIYNTFSGQLMSIV